MWILLTVFLSLALDCSNQHAFEISYTVYPFSLAALPYDYSFLSEFLSSRIVMYHHDDHQKSYKTHLNAYINTTLFFNETSLGKLCMRGWGNSNLQKYAGGLYNHYLYWWGLTQSSCTSPVASGPLLTAIQESWKDFPTFVAAFAYAGNVTFGNEWVWLCVNTTGMLEIQTTTYQMNPLMFTGANTCYPILGMDLWEHAYYLKYTYDKNSYISDFMNSIDWTIIEYFYENFARYLVPVPL